MTPEAPGPEVTDDTLYGGRVSLRQPRRGHRAGTDAVLLAGLAEVGPHDRVVDLGSGSGAVGLMVAARATAARIVLVERDVALADLARDNVGLNGFDNRVSVAAADAFLPADWAAAGLAEGAADLVVTNPPFFEPGMRASPDRLRRAAHVHEGGDLAAWISAAARILKPRGRLCLIHRADRLADCLKAMGPRFGSLVVVPIHPRADADASRVLLHAVQGGRSPLKLRPPLVLHAADGAFTPAAAALHAGRGSADERPDNEKGAEAPLPKECRERSPT